MDYFTSILSAAGGGFSLPYTIGEQHGQCWGGWEHYRATANADKKPVSLFKMVLSKTDTLAVESARNGVKRLRTTKHPRILSFEWAGEQESGGKITIHLVTEPVTPLPTLIDELNLSGQQRSKYLSLGLRQAAEAVAFLSQCKIVHGNVCWHSILVTSDLDWRLGFFDVSSDHASLSSSMLMRNGRAVAPQYRPGELDKGQFDGPVWAVDAWGLGCLVQEVFSSSTLSDKDQLRSTSCIPAEVLPDYKNLLHSVPSKRLDPAHLVDNAFLKNDLVDTITFLEDLSIKDPGEKSKFFRNLPSLIPTFPDVVCTRKLLPLVSSALSYGGAPALALGCLLQIGKMLPDDEFKARIVPILSSLFGSADPNIRTTLLESVPHFAPFLSEKIVESNIFPQLSAGLTGSSAVIREATLKAMLPLAPKISQRTLTTTLLKQLDKLQVDQEPSIRANTTVLLGNIARQLGPAACKRVLLNAFSRALRDVYPPSRAAALRALMATAPYHAPQAVACRVLPAVSPLMIDPQPDVRKAASQALEFFAKTLKTSSTEMEAGLDLTKAPAELDSAADDPASKAASTMSSLLGWAITSVSAATGAAGGGAGATVNAGPAAVKPPASGGPATRGGGMRPPPDPAQSSGAYSVGGANNGFGAGAKAGAASRVPSSQAGLDGWGADELDDEADGWEDMDDALEQLEVSSTGQHATAGGGGASSNFGTPVATTFSGSGSRGGSMDMNSFEPKISEGDGWGDMGSGWDVGPAAPAPAAASSAKKAAKPKGKLKLGVSKKSDGKGD